ncbi:hypothetical protein Tco_0531486 [Tanacetum coccineum]
MKVEESLNVTFDESPPPTKLSPIVDDDVSEEESIENNIKEVKNNNIKDETVEVDEFGLEDSKPTKTPISMEIKLTKDDEADSVDSTKYRESSETSKLMEKIEALTTKIDSQLKEIKGEMKEIRDGCSKCRGPHPSVECHDKPMRGPREEANYTYGGYRGGGYRGNYYSRNSKNWNDRQPQDDHRYSPPREDSHSTLSKPEKKLEETHFEKTIREFVLAQRSPDEFVRNQFFNLKTKVEHRLKNHQAVI